jgi:adenosylhomocysteine nucleosidase
MDTIILIAIPEEAPGLTSHPAVFFTGVGKVNAAILTAVLIERHRPSTVINFGTAGGITLSSGLHQVTRFVQRDMMCDALGFEPGQTPFESHVALGTPGVTCGSGDSFVNDPAQSLGADLVDMESYAIAKACANSNTRFLCFKYVSDQADSTAPDDWKHTVAQGESHYISKLKELSLY